ncbi:autophagy-related protein 2 [Microdochium nivale]|nr:autophagy-related protein 2 [Microdochium nivale]
MPDFLSSFWGSDLPKRMLRYALTRLDMLDTDGLDMDKLDFTLGRNSVATFQDVGIKLEKLEKLLGLPPTFRLQRARVLSLRITIPAAIYSSPIVVEVDGVQIKLRIGGGTDTDKDPRATDKTRSDKNTEELLVPHAIDLAQSFLEAQPVTEKAELQAALDAETNDLSASITGSEDGSDEEPVLGTGQALSLPAFLANFLQGIADRTQVTIKGVVFETDVHVPLEPNSTMQELVTFQLGIDDIDIEGVTNEVQTAAAESDPPQIQPKEGKRLIMLSSIKACLISEANVFSTLARTPSMHSSTAANSPATTRQHSFSSQPAVSASLSSLPGGHLEDSMELEQTRYFAMMDSEDAFNIPYELDEASQSSEPGEARSPPLTPKARPTELPESPVSARMPIRPSQSSIEMVPEMWASVESNSRTEPVGHRSRTFESGWRAPLGTTPAGSKISMTESVTLGEPVESDLERSQVFSHKEAESMYMSAFSNASESEAQSRIHPGMTASSTDAGYARDAIDDLPLNALEQDGPSNQSAVGIRPLQDNEEAVSNVASRHELSAGSEAEEAKTSVMGRLQSSGEVATPRGPTRLVKELVSLASIAIHVPSTHKTSNLPPGAEPFPMSPSALHNLDHSMAPNMPGTFSVYSPGLARTSSPQQERKEATTAPVDDRIEVSLAPLVIRFDLSTGFLLTMVVSQIMSALSTKPAERPSSKSDEAKTKVTTPEVAVAIEQICVHFMETLAGVADTAERALMPSQPLDDDALLSLDLQKLQVNMCPIEGGAVTSVDLAKFKFGYGNDDIISLDQSLQMRASVRDAFPSAGSDVSLKITQAKGLTRCEAKTLPIHVKLDLQRLDETFSWFGGLSSFLNMSSSMTSSHSTQIAPPSPAKASKKLGRGVRFDAPIRVDDVSATSENKANLRIGGFHLDLIGKECSLAVDTSAVKVVSREEGIGVGISKIEVAGPILRGSMASPPIQASINNARIEYLVTPKDVDLERLLELITPSKYKFDQKDDEIMVDTLLRQRRKGAVLRVNVDDVQVEVSNLPLLHVLPGLGEEVARLSSVAKYLPEDDRPGILTLGLFRNIDVGVDIGGKFGSLQTSLKDLEVGHISVPSLVALGISSISVRRNHKEELIGNAVSSQSSYGPVITMRIIADEMEPVIRLRMRHINVEYRVPTIMDMLGLGEETTPQEFEASLATSVANLGEHAHSTIAGKKPATVSKSEKGKKKDAKPTRVDIAFRDCLIGLNPLNKSSKLIVALTDAQLQVALSSGDDAQILTTLNKSSILLIDDVALLDRPRSSTSRRRSSNSSTPQIVELCHRGFVDICYLSSAKATVQIGTNRRDGNKFIDIEVRDDLLVLETCADSTQTLIALANALSPPTPPSKETKYRTKVVPMQDLLASISADAFGQAEGEYDFDEDFGLAQELGGEDDEGLDSEFSSQSSPLDVDSHYYEDPGLDASLPRPEDSYMSGETVSRDTQDGVLLTNFSSQPDDAVEDEDDLVIHENYFGQGSVIQGTAHRWNSAKNEYDEANNEKVERSPLSVRVRDVHIIWNLFDGYDWSHTRDVISEAVAGIEAKAYEREAGRDRLRLAGEPEISEEETVIGDFLFNSIYIGIPANRDPRELAAAINQELNDNATETESIATTAMTATPSRQGSAQRRKRLKLNRSRRHKITFELQGIDVDLLTFPPGSGETQSSIDVRIRDINVFDHVPTSTWKKFLTYDQDAGERELGTSMAHLEILTVKPLPELGASEFVLKVTLLPLRLHVDQDALDFITRFFEFKDESAPPVHSSPSDIPFVQRAEVNSIPVNLDFKPKRVDYTGLRSGRTTEMMNFIVLDAAHLVLRHTIIYGVRGFDRLGETLNDIWTPDVKRNQLPGILAGLAPIRSIVNVGSGFKNLIEVPIKEYQKDGRIVRSIGKGAAAFAKTTGTEIVKLGAKLAVGTQYALQGAEGILTKQPESSRAQTGWNDLASAADFDDQDDEATKQISLYADQPTGVVQGLRGAYSSLRRDLNVARDAIIAVPSEVMESENAQGAARAVLRRAPTIIFRPLIGSTKAIGQTLMGATNSLDPQNRRRADEKYKRH